MKEKILEKYIDTPKKLILVICTIAMLAFTVFAAICIANTNSPIRTTAIKEDAKDFSSDWYNEHGVKYNLQTYSTQKMLSVDKPLFVTKKLNNITDGCVLYIHSRNVVINVYINDRLCYKCTKSGRVRNNLSGFDNHILVDIPVSANGKEIKLELYCTEVQDVCCMDRVMIGNGVKMLKTVSSDGVLQLFGSVLYIASAVVFIILGFITLKKLDNAKVYIYFGLFLMLISVCIALNSVCAYFIIRNNYFIEKGSRLFLTAAIPTLLTYMYLSYGFMHDDFVRIVLYVSAIMVPTFFITDFIGILPYTSAGMIIDIFIMIVCLILIVEIIIILVNYKKVKTHYLHIYYIIGMFFILCVIFDIWYSYQGINGGDDYYMTRIGLIFLIGGVMYTAVHELFAIVKLGVQAGMIGKIAFTDANTGIGNTAAFKMKMEEYEENKMKYRYIGIIQFDVNNLKVINDTKGHEAGDLLIKTAADIIDQTFGKVGTCYRTGGDEFVAIITGDYAPSVYEETIYRFEKRIERFDADENRPFDLRIAYGVAYFENEKTQNMTLKEVHKIADERMYDKKKQLKARYAHTAEEAVIR